MVELPCQATLSERTPLVYFGCPLLVRLTPQKEIEGFPIPETHARTRVRITRTAWRIACTAHVALYCSPHLGGWDPYLLYSAHLTHDEQDPIAHTTLISPAPNDRLHWLGDAKLKLGWAVPPRFISLSTTLDRAHFRTLGLLFGDMNENWAAHRLLPRRRPASLSLSDAHLQFWISLR